MSTIKEQLEAAIAARRDSLKELRKRIVAILEPIPIGVVLTDHRGEVCRVVRIYAGASQWSNRNWDVKIKGAGYLSNRQLLAEDIEDSVFDGSNVHYRRTGCYLNVDDGGYGYELSFLSGAETRALAARLPVAVAAYMERCRVEAELNNNTLTGTAH